MASKRVYIKNKKSEAKGDNSLSFIWHTKHKMCSVKKNLKLTYF